jgi:hypothetical protein
MAQPQLIPAHIDYTGKDWQQIYDRLRNLIRSVFPRWTEEAVADFGNILLGMYADVGDHCMFYLDTWARESRLGSAQLRRSILGLVRLIGYEPFGAQAARATETFTLSAAAANNVTLSAGTVVKTAKIVEPTRYQLLEVLVFAPGETSKTAIVENSEFATDSFTSAETPDLSYQLTGTPFLEDTEAISAGNGDYERVDTLLLSSSTDRHYTLTVDAEERASFTFGDGVKGAIPIGQIDASYKIGGGTAGAVEAETLVVLEGTPYSDELGNPVAISVTNEEQSTPGANRQSNRSIKTIAPLSVAVQGRAVSRPDFETVSKLVSGVGRALMLFRDEDSAVPENWGYLYIVPTDGGEAPLLLLQEVRSRFEPVEGYPDPSHPKMNTLNLEVRSAPYQDVDITSTVYFRQGVTPAEGAAAIRAVLERYFALQIEASQLIADAPDVAEAYGITAADGDTLVDNPRVDFGLEFRDIDGNPTSLLPWSDIFDAIRDTDEVIKVDPGVNGLLLNGERADLSIESFNFPVLGTVSLTDGDTGQAV